MWAANGQGRALGRGQDSIGGIIAASRPFKELRTEWTWSAQRQAGGRTWAALPDSVNQINTPSAGALAASRLNNTYSCYSVCVATGPVKIGPWV
jgi:hypothetical protein